MRRIRLCSRRASSSSSSAYSFSARHPLPEGDFERPTPVLLISGEGLGVNLWRPYAELLSKRGYCGSVMSIDPATRSVRQAARSIENAVRRSGYWPPVMIAHSSSSLVAQKYLESFSLAGLVMVSPFPTDPSAAASRALNLLDEVLLARGVSTADVQQGEHNLSNEELAQCLRRLYNCVDISDVLETQGSRLPIALLREMSSDAACKVNLEPGERHPKHCSCGIHSSCVCSACAHARRAVGRRFVLHYR